MASMDHTCLKCDATWMDNAFVVDCPVCGEKACVTNLSDEPESANEYNYDEAEQYD